MATTPPAIVFSKTSELPDADTLLGTELIRIIQNSGDAKVAVSVLLEAALVIAKVKGLVTTDTSAVANEDGIVVALGKLQAQLNKAVNEDEVGSAPNQVPVNQLLGRTAFGDVVGATQVYQHVHASVPGDVWHEWVSNTQLKHCFHGLDNVVRTQVVNYA